MMKLFIFQVKQALLALKQKPIFAATVVTSMGIALGALLSVMTLLYVTVFKPLPYPDAEHLYLVESKIKGNARAPKVSMYPYPALVDLYQKQALLQQASLIMYESNNITSIKTSPRVNTSYITPEFTQLTGMELVLGRSFVQQKDLESVQPQVIISHRLWVEQFEQRANVLAETLTIGGVNFVIIGVAKSDYHEPALYEVGRYTDLWLPWNFNGLSERGRQSWGNFAPNMMMLAKYDNALTSPQASDELGRYFNESWQQHVHGNPRFSDMSLVLELKSLSSVLASNNQYNIYLVLAAVIGLAIITVTNVAQLFMAKSSGQQRRQAIAVSLGANHRQLYNQALLEVTCLMGLSLLCALAVAKLGFIATNHYLSSEFERLNEIGFWLAPVIMVVAMTVLISLIFTKLTISGVKFSTIYSQLQTANKGAVNVTNSSLRQVFIASQIAITVLIVFANLLIFNTSMSSLLQPLGFEVKNIERLTLAYNGNERLSAEQQLQVISQIKQEINMLPSVLAVSQGASPLSRFSGRPFTLNSSTDNHVFEQKYVDHQYFSLVEQALISGEHFSEHDVSAQQNVVIVNQQLAQELAPLGDVIGQSIKTSRDEVLTIKGIVGNIQLPEKTERMPRVYRPINASRELGFIVRVVDEMQLDRAAIAALIDRVDSRFSIFQLTPLSSQYFQRIFGNIVALASAIVLTVLVLVLAGIGLLGIYQFNTQLRRFEIGTRLAVGAKRKNIILLIIKDNAVAVFIGFALSILVIGFSYFSPLMSLTSFTSATVLLYLLLTLSMTCLLTFTASYLPLRRYLNQPVSATLRGQS